ncbi:MAG: hypothetical protein ABW321_08560 [Polyangiales bacterium]
MTMEPAPARSRDVPRLLIMLITGAALVMAASLFNWAKPRPTPSESQSQPAAADHSVPLALPSPPSPPPSAAPAPPSAAPAPPSAAALPRAAAHPTTDDPTPTESHPITPERVALQRELALVGALNDAVDLGDVVALRSLIARYHSEVPDDPNALGAGYARIADCLEQPGESSRAAARAYYDRERASTIRRYVRRACFANE